MGSGLVVQRGQCLVMLAFDVGQAIDLDTAERRLKESPQRERIKQRRRTPASFQFSPAPLRIAIAAAAEEVGKCRTDPAIELLAFDFGAVSVTFRVPLSGPLEMLLDVADELYENERLIAAARRAVEDFLRDAGDAVRGAGVARFVEDYVVYQLAELRPRMTPEELVERHGVVLAGVLRAERGALSGQEIKEALSERVSYGPADLAVLDWNAAVLLDEDADDLLAVLEYANVELLEMRVLDDHLDRLLDESYGALSRPRRLPLIGRADADIRRIARLQTDSAVLFEGVNNAVKLLGDQYLARVYRCVSQRLHLPEWDASILRKLQTVESIYTKLADQQGTRRMEVLEWIIIVLILLSIVIAFVPGGH